MQGSFECWSILGNCCCFIRSHSCFCQERWNCGQPACLCMFVVSLLHSPEREREREGQREWEREREKKERKKVNVAEAAAMWSFCWTVPNSFLSPLLRFKQRHCQATHVSWTHPNPSAWCDQVLGRGAWLQYTCPTKGRLGPWPAFHWRSALLFACLILWKHIQKYKLHASENAVKYMLFNIKSLHYVSSFAPGLAPPFKRKVPSRNSACPMVLAENGQSRDLADLDLSCFCICLSCRIFSLPNPPKHIGKLLSPWFQCWFWGCEPCMGLFVSLKVLKG